MRQDTTSDSAALYEERMKADAALHKERMKAMEDRIDAAFDRLTTYMTLVLVIFASMILTAIGASTSVIIALLR